MPNRTERVDEWRPRTEAEIDRACHEVAILLQERLIQWFDGVKDEKNNDVIDLKQLKVAADVNDAVYDQARRSAGLPKERAEQTELFGRQGFSFVQWDQHGNPVVTEVPGIEPTDPHVPPTEADPAAGDLPAEPDQGALALWGPGERQDEHRR